jgi:hypothetical protein
MARREKSPERISVGDIAAETKLGSQALTLNDDEAIQLLTAAVEREGNQGAFARRHGLERTYLNQVLKRKKPVAAPF